MGKWTRLTLEICGVDDTYHGEYRMRYGVVISLNGVLKFEDFLNLRTRKRFRKCPQITY